MIRPLRFVIGTVLILALLAPAFGQDSRQFYKKPETTGEFWRAMNHEIELGQFDVAAGYLKGFLARNPSDAELLQLHDRFGSAAFHRLLTIPELRADAKGLVERVDALVQKHLSDPKRLNILIRNLNGSPEERSYAIAQLSRAGAAAMPALIDALIRPTSSGEHAAILSALPKLDRAIIPPLLAALDVDDPNVRRELIDVLAERAETSATPYLWYLAASPKQPTTVRDRALRVLATFLGIPGAERAPVAELAVKLPPAKVELTREAERYYQHQVRFPALATTPVWRWESARRQLVSEALSVPQAEEYHGLHFAGQALDLDPSYTPAQVVYLSFLLDKGSGRPGVKDVLRASNPELVNAVLNKALNEQRLPVILAAAAGLGDQVEVRALRSTRSDVPPLVRTLDYPDRRAQLTAADAILRIGVPPAPPVAARVVEILGRAVAGDAEAKAQPKVLLGFANVDLGNRAARSARQAGFQAVVVNSGRDLLRRLHEAADIDLILVDAGLSDPGLAPLLAQLHVDRDAGRLPVVVTAPGGQEEPLRGLTERYREERQRSEASRDLGERFQQQRIPDLAERAREETARREESLARLGRRYGEESAALEENLRRATAGYPNVTVISASQIWDGERLGPALQARLADPANKPLAGAEGRDTMARALEWLARLAHGEVPGYDLRPAAAPILRALQAKELAHLAVEAAGALPGPTAQRDLANVLLDQARPEELRSAAAIAVCRHIQQHGLLLTPEQTRGIDSLYDGSAGPKLKANVARVLGSMHPDARQTGERLRRFTPVFAPPGAPAPTEGGEDKKEGAKSAAANG